MNAKRGKCLSTDNCLGNFFNSCYRHTLLTLRTLRTRCARCTRCTRCTCFAFRTLWTYRTRLARCAVFSIEISAFDFLLHIVHKCVHFCDFGVRRFKPRRVFVGNCTRRIDCFADYDFKNCRLKHGDFFTVFCLRYSYLHFDSSDNR